MENELNTIDDTFPFDLTKDLEWNMTSLKNKLIRDGMTEEKADKFILIKKSEYYKNNKIELKIN